MTSLVVVIATLKALFGRVVVLVNNVAATLGEAWRTVVAKLGFTATKDFVAKLGKARRTVDASPGTASKDVVELGKARRTVDASPGTASKNVGAWLGTALKSFVAWLGMAPKSFVAWLGTAPKSFVAWLGTAPRNFVAWLHTAPRNFVAGLRTAPKNFVAGVGTALKNVVTKLGAPKSFVAKLDRTAMKTFVGDLAHQLTPVFAIGLLVLSMGGSWRLAGATPPTIAEEIAAESPPEPERPAKKAGRALTGKININTATEEQLMLLPTVGPAKAERIVHWRKKNGGFRRTADLRRVKGFGYKTYKRLEPFLEIKGDTTLK